MSKRKSQRGDRVSMTVYVPSMVKVDMQIAAVLSGRSLSDLVELLCRKYLEECPEVKEARESQK